jgi:glycosyltransferase involved in cell wall biosynthesis
MGTEFWPKRPEPIIGAGLSDNDQIDLTLFVACYNEENDIVGTLDTLLASLAEVQLSWEIIVIDDASSDRSVQRIEEYLARHPHLPIRLVVNSVNRGLAQNYIESAFLGRGKYHRLICGDNVEPEDTFVTLFRHVGQADMIIPYQVACEGKSSGRQFLSKTYTAIINAISGYHLRYYNGLAIHLRYNIMRWHTNYRGFGFQADMITRLLDAGFNYVEVPVYARERQAGKSTALKLINILSVCHTILDLIIRRIGRLIYKQTALPSVKSAQAVQETADDLRCVARPGDE